MDCDKIPYETWDEAQRIVNRLKAIRLYNNGRRVKGNNIAKLRPKRVYKCPLCGKYHLTHLKRKNKCLKRK